MKNSLALVWVHLWRVKVRTARWHRRKTGALCYLQARLPLHTTEETVRKKRTATQRNTEYPRIEILQVLHITPPLKRRNVLWRIFQYFQPENRVVSGSTKVKTCELNQSCNSTRSCVPSFDCSGILIWVKSRRTGRNRKMSGIWHHPKKSHKHGTGSSAPKIPNWTQIGKSHTLLSLLLKLLES